MQRAPLSPAPTPLKLPTAITAIAKTKRFKQMLEIATSKLQKLKPSRPSSPGAGPSNGQGSDSAHAFLTNLNINLDQHQVIPKLENALSANARFKWAFYNKDKFDGLLSKLEKSNKLLYESTERIRNPSKYPNTPINSTPFSPSLEGFELSELPFSLNTKFCGREDILEAIQDAFQPPDPSGPRRMFYKRQVYLLHGIGGIGKTQIALRYAHESKSANRYKTILWINVTDIPFSREPSADYFPR